MSMLKKRLGTITITAALSVAVPLLAGFAWIVTYINQSVAPVEAQTEQNRSDIASMDTNIAWIKSALEQNGIKPKLSSPITE